MPLTETKADDVSSQSNDFVVHIPESENRKFAFINVLAFAFSHRPLFCSGNKSCVIERASKYRKIKHV